MTTSQQIQYAGMRCSAGQVHVTLRSKSALLRLGTQSRPKDVQSLPFTSSPYTSATRKAVGSHYL